MEIDSVRDRVPGQFQKMVERVTKLASGSWPDARLRQTCRFKVVCYHYVIGHHACNLRTLSTEHLGGRQRLDDRWAN
jgi:hypothetical protein